MDRLDALRLFCRVVETGSFSEAAREANLGQPQVSRAVAALEQRWGATLLQRSTRKLSLTEVGRRVYEQARELLQQHEELEAAALGGDREPVGLLRVSASIAFARSEIVPHVPAFLAAYPHVKLDLQTHDDRIDVVAEGVDLAFRLGPLDDSSLTARRIRGYRRQAVAAPTYLKKAGAPAEPQDLAGHQCVVFTTTVHRHRWVFAKGRRREEVEVGGMVSASSGRVLTDLVKLGCGVAFGPSFLFRQGLATGSLAPVLPDWSGPPLELHALWPRRELPRKGRVFLDFMLPRLAATLDG
jgi:DNA-binding transcriptional LysR family regulator